MEGRIALSAFELKDADRSAKAFDVRLHVGDEPLLVEDVRVADGREI